MGLLSKLRDMLKPDDTLIHCCSTCPAWALHDGGYKGCLYSTVFTDGAHCWQYDQILLGKIPSAGMPSGVKPGNYVVVTTKPEKKDKQIPTTAQIAETLGVKLAPADRIGIYNPDDY